MADHDFEAMHHDELDDLNAQLKAEGAPKAYRRELMSVRNRKVLAYLRGERIKALMRVLGDDFDPDNVGDLADQIRELRGAIELEPAAAVMGVEGQ